LKASPIVTSARTVQTPREISRIRAGFMG
jgi:hypothetical protein